MKTLDKKGFVFIDDNGNPYYIRMNGNEPWVYYWAEGIKGWVTLRKVNQMQIWKAYDRKLPDDQAQIYHNIHKENFGFNPSDGLYS